MEFVKHINKSVFEKIPLLRKTYFYTGFAITHVEGEQASKFTFSGTADCWIWQSPNWVYSSTMAQLPNHIDNCKSVQLENFARVK